MAVTAAVSGHGLLLGYSGYVDAEVAAGALVYPFALRVPTGKGYHLVYRKERLVDPRVRALREWVTSEAAGAGVAAEQAVRQRPWSLAAAPPRAAAEVGRAAGREPVSRYGWTPSCA